MNWLETMRALEDRAKQNIPFDGDEYVNELDNGLLYCKKCRTRRQTVVEVDDGNGQKFELRPPVPCKCMQERMDAERKTEEDRKRQERLAVMKRMSGIPALYEDASFASFVQRSDNATIFQMASRYAAKFGEMKRLGKGLLFHGDVGTGKTYAAACIARAVIEAEYSVFMTSTYDMLKLRDPEDEERYEDRILGSSLLIIDDIGAERTTDYGREKVFGYIDGRCNTGLPMIFTTNIDFQKMLKPETQQEARIYDRILKRCFPVAFTGSSWRRAEARDNFADMKAILNGVD